MLSLNFLTEKKYRVLRHLAILIFLFIVIINYDGRDLNNKFDSSDKYYLLSFTYFILVVFFYVNMYILIPRILYKKYYVTYLLSLVIGVCLEFFVIRLFVEHILEPDPTIHDSRQFGFFTQLFNVATTMLPFILSSTALKLFQRWISDNEKIVDLENKALKVELQALKNQINPHFLFNMLNNLNILIGKDPEKASYVTIKLSDFLRHHLYDKNRPMVMLSSEIKFIRDFLELEKIRRDDFTFAVNLTGTEVNDQKVPSHILSVFVENAIKHSLDSDLPSEAQIDFHLENGFITFKCRNTKPNMVTVKKNEGLGLQNVKRRLDLLYGTTYTFLIEDRRASYSIDLRLPL